MNAEVLSDSQFDAPLDAAPTALPREPERLEVGPIRIVGRVECDPVHTHECLAGTLALELDARRQGVARAAGNVAVPVVRAGPGGVPHPDDLFSVRVRTADPTALRQVAEGLTPYLVSSLTETVLAAHLPSRLIWQLAEASGVERIDPKPRFSPRLIAACRDVGIWGDGGRAVEETGEGVFIGVVDTGFGLDHPMFRDDAGRLRVAALWDQETGRVYDRDELEQGWKDATRPGADENGHGTHVASICGGSYFRRCAGLAPGAEFLLVRSNEFDTDRAVQWIFARAGDRPCVVNLSSGHHWGAHDGSDAEERLFASFTGPGRIIVVAAGNEQKKALHVRGDLAGNDEAALAFDVLPQPDEPCAEITLWHDARDSFQVWVTDPAGTRYLPDPSARVSAAPRHVVSFARETGGTSVNVQIKVVPGASEDLSLEGWSLGIRCVKAATTGRVDAWFADAGYARFRDHTMVSAKQTIVLPGTGDATISVGSYVTRTIWSGLWENVGGAVRGRSSDFTSLGPTRDERCKPDISAPGQYVAAALASNSLYARLRERVVRSRGLVAVAGTSMAAPVVTGAVALMLQVDRTLGVADVRQILRETARRDDHTGPANWDEAYGYGKIDVAAALAAVRGRGAKAAV